MFTNKKSSHAFHSLDSLPFALDHRRAHDVTGSTRQARGALGQLGQNHVRDAMTLSRHVNVNVGLLTYVDLPKCSSARRG